MLKRFLFAIPAIALMLFAVFEQYTGGVLFLGIVLVSAYISVLEYIEFFRDSLSRHARLVSVVFTIMFVAASHIATLSTHGFVLLLAIPFFALLLLVSGELHKKDFSGTPKAISLGLLPVFYIGVGFGALLFLKSLGQTGAYLLLYLLLTVWITDSFALFCGKLFGRHSLGLAASPKKTVEGTGGGILFAVLAAFIMREFIPEIHQELLLFKWWFLLPVTIMLSVTGQIGDLAVSMLKRAVGVKDSSSLVPGHGGALDVFDAQIMAAPFLYLIVFIIAR